MSLDPDDLVCVVRYALETTRATAICPFHLNVTVRVGDDAAESHAWNRARNVTKSDGMRWNGEAIRQEFDRQFGKAADSHCPQCAHANLVDPSQ